MNKSLVIAIFLGLLSSTEAIKITSNSDETNVVNNNVQQIHLQMMQKKTAEAKEKSNATLQKINQLKQKITEKKPSEQTKIQTKKDENMVINIEALSKPDNENKIKELEAMEQALAKATEEAHKQKLKLTGQDLLA